MEIKDYIKDDEIKILELFHLTFGKPLSEPYWKWRFIDNPENKIMIKLMWDNETLAGHYAVSPVKINVKGDTILTALSMATMTHPKFTGKGIFTELAETLYREESKKNDLKAAWGFPNNNSHYGFIKKLNWIDLEQIPTFSIGVEKIKKTNFSEIKLVTSFDENHIKTQQKLPPANKIKVEKSIEYLTWRYIKNPINHYTIFEFKDNANTYFAVTKVFSSFSDKDKFEVDILELNFPNDYDSLLQLMNAIFNHYKDYDLLKINTWLSVNDSKHLQLEKIGFLNISPITYLGIRILDEKYKQLEESKSWLYSMGDSDIY